jgi:hypothetical protein
MNTSLRRLGFPVAETGVLGGWNGVRSVRVWARVLGVERVVVDGVVLEGDGSVISVRPGRGARQRCGICQRRSPRFDAGEGRRRWRALDLGSTMTFLEADAPRVQCREHGVVVSAVPWRDTGPAAPEPSRWPPPSALTGTGSPPPSRTASPDPPPGPPRRCAPHRGDARARRSRIGRRVYEDQRCAPAAGARGGRGGRVVTLQSEQGP